MSSSKKSSRGTSVASDFSQALQETPAFEPMRYTANYVRMAQLELSASEFQDLMAGLKEAGRLLPENFNPDKEPWPPEAEEVNQRMEEMLKIYDNLAGCFKQFVQSAQAAGAGSGACPLDLFNFSRELEPGGTSLIQALTSKLSSRPPLPKTPYNHLTLNPPSLRNTITMSNYYSSQQPQYPAAGGPNAAQNLQFFPSQYTNPGSSTPQQAAAAGYGYGNQGGYGVGAPAQNFAAPAFGAQGVSGRMGEQGGLRTGWVAAFSSEGYDGEPPLLEELGVNFGHIQAKTLAVLNPFRRIDSHIMDDSDLAGPLIFFLLFGFILLFSGQVHFGYIYGLAALGSISLHLILSLMSPSDASEPQVNSYPQYSSDPSAPQQQHDGQQGGHFSATLTYPRSASVLGYCLLPLVATSLFGIVMRMDTPVGIVATTAAILWCTYSASGMFCAVGQMKRMRGLVAYPLALFYVGFGIMGIFSSRGSGTFSNAAAKLNA
ncbi:hypothetical protein FOXYS1_10459 [Fusarium oxysporum]|uniref:Yip1 domain-containing protein n=11 Tax=Fusarium oxysporum TaxID=5507 RepID=A0A8H5A5G8_FUSOX|nr:hypothetical protein FOXYS1_10459 [Fusarium oxysporum]